MSEILGNKEEKKQKVKELINRLHRGEDPDQVKEELKDVIKGLTAFEIAHVEGEMIREGMPREEIHAMCDVHLAAMKEAIETDAPVIPEGHPVRILLGEHREFLTSASRIRELATQIKARGSPEEVALLMDEIKKLVARFKEEELHYQREENVLFPYLEKHGITEPPTIMWMDHDRIRNIKKNLAEIIEIFDYIINDLKQKDPKVTFVYFDAESGKVALASARRWAKYYNFNLNTEV